MRSIYITVHDHTPDSAIGHNWGAKKTIY